MATNMYKKYDESKTREWDVVASQLPAAATPVPGGTLIKHALSGQIGVTLTASGAATRAAGIPGVTGGTIANGGVGNKANGAVVAVDGTWLFSVAAVTAGDTTLPSGAPGRGTPSGTPVFQNNTTGALTLVATSSTRIGVVDDGVIVGLITPIKIGV
jgi:hypothetical protein